MNPYGRDKALTDDQRPQAEDLDVMAQVRDWDPGWAELYRHMATNPWRTGNLSPRTVELICVALHAACTALDAQGTRTHIRSALAAGASRDDVLTVLKMASLLAIHSCSLGAPLLIEEAQAAGVALVSRSDEIATPASDAMREMGQWNTAWDPFFALDPAWTDQFMAAGYGIYADQVLSAKEVELLSIAFDASVRHMYGPGTRRHIAGALAEGATVGEIMDVLKLCVAFGASSLQMGIPILAEELAKAGAT